MNGDFLVRFNNILKLKITYRIIYLETAPRLASE